MHIIIIGSGFGGLALGIRLQSHGYMVTIMEKNAFVGGHAYPFEKNGYKFDMGPSLITATSVIDRLFETAGYKRNEKLEFVKLEPYYRIIFHDDTFIDYSGDTQRMTEQMSKFNKRDAKNYHKFMRISKKIYDAVILKGLGSTPFMDWGTMLKFVPQAVRLGAILPAFTFTKRYFKDPRHRFTFSFHPLFIGGNPFRAPAVYQMIPYLEKEEGVWYTMGGMTTLVNSLKDLFLQTGGRIMTNTEVKKINVRNNQAVGVTTNDTYYPADAVVSNADFLHTYKELLPTHIRKHWTDKKLQKLHYSMSAFLLFLGVKTSVPKILHHTIILSKRYKTLLSDIFDRKILPDDFSMYIHAPTKTDPSMAPPGCESIFILVPVANLQGNIDWQTKTPEFTERILNFLENKLGVPGLKKNIQVLESFTPLDFMSKQNATYGSAWGVEPKLTQTGIFRPFNKCPDIDRFYLVGASTHPGAGLPGVLMTAETTEKLVVKDLKNG
ncbi:phytoene desaturase [candidate division KSB1 bacterium]|nr:phytoene desaturase [candidate division KSB1 bacterium]